MKKLTIIGLFVVIVTACVLLHWQHVKTSEFDKDFRENLVGTWLRELENMRCTYIVAPDGSFTGKAVFSHPDRTNTYLQAGTWQVQDGSLIETVTKDSNKSAQVPRSHSGRIIFVNTNEFIVAWQGSTNRWVWQRVSP